MGGQPNHHMVMHLFKRLVEGNGERNVSTRGRHNANALEGIANIPPHMKSTARS